jgi:hypothetical protein
MHRRQSGHRLIVEFDQGIAIDPAIRLSNLGRYDVDGIVTGPFPFDRASGPPYYTNASTSGSVRGGELPSSIVILESPDDQMPIGIANQVCRNDHGQAVWVLRVHRADVPGRFVIVDGQFVLEPWADLREFPYGAMSTFSTNRE